MSSRVPAISIIGWSGAGKTSLVERLIAELASRGLRVAAVKHSSDDHPLHRSGSDTARFQATGAALTGFATPSGVQLTTGASPTQALPELLTRLAGAWDVALVEGWKDGPLPKLEVWREGLGPPLAESRPGVFALVTDAPSAPTSAARVLSSRDTSAIADAILQHLRPPRRAPLPPADARGLASRPVQRWNGDTLLALEDDTLAVEEPLELRVNGETLATTMRTPGYDRELAVGFLLAEGLIRGANDLATLAHCGRPGEEGWGNTLEVTPAPGVIIDPEARRATRRGTLTTSACGVCGRRSVEDLLAACTPLPPGPVLPPAAVARATERLREVQRNFARTGGVHAALALDAEGQLLAGHEDVGRHNAVDKVVGALLLSGALRASAAPERGMTRQPAILAVSGRVSFEIVQKAVMARIPVIAGVSAATTLAIDLALRSGVTLATFVRNGRFNIHTHPERLGPR
ncbi:formate dehydrogenase accessory sulfurtransferase FdhD [Myxococcus stipitatus]|uniref:formate dehydrogenase accessory sulfurtransferase FdhD n=1 Tax=Myxococcus stipitatus TaxID=83455 RepID=UPI003144F22C